MASCDGVRGFVRCWEWVLDNGTVRLDDVEALGMMGVIEYDPVELESVLDAKIKVIADGTPLAY